MLYLMLKPSNPSIKERCSISDLDSNHCFNLSTSFTTSNSPASTDAPAPRKNTICELLFTSSHKWFNTGVYLFLTYRK